MRQTFIFTFFLQILLISAVGQKSTHNLEKHIRVLCSDTLEGRKVGTLGEQKAAKYIRNIFKEQNLELLGEDGFLNFEVITKVEATQKNKFSLFNIDYKLGEDYLPINLTKNDSLFANVYFAGYGFDIETDSLKWCDYPSTFHINRMWVVVIRGVPDPQNENSKFYPFASDAQKIEMARKRGAKGIVLVSPKYLSEEDGLMPLRIVQSLENKSIIAINASRKAASKLFWNYGINFDNVEKNYNYPMEKKGVFIPAKIANATELKYEKSTASNVVGLIEGNNPVLKDEYIIIAANHDHIGYGDLNLNPHKTDTIAIHSGANNNASAVAMLLDLSEKISKNRRRLKRSVVFVSFSAKEYQYLGSKVFLKEELIPISKIKYMINLNMVGGLDSERNIYINGVGTAKEFDSVLEQFNKKHQFKLHTNIYGYSASDANNFFQKSIPVLTFSTGVQEFYNTPYDDISKINFAGIRDLSAFVYDLIINLSQRENSFKFQEQPMPKQRFADLKMDLGIGCKSTKDSIIVNKVLQNSVAEQSGLMLEDKITKINGQIIKDRSDFERILSSLYVGQTATIEFYRDEKKHIIILQL
jgi:hypothetical protein